MNSKNIKKVVIAGGGTSGWLAAASISKLLGKNLDVCLIESEEIGRVGVGEATIPTMRGLNRLLGINEQDFMRSTQSTFKLGIEFKNWGFKGDSYLHSFGRVGKDCWACDFQHFWLAGKQKGLADDFGSYCVEYEAAKVGKITASENSGLNYAFHLDAGLYAEFLKSFSIRHGAKRIEGKIKTVITDEESGFINSLILDSGDVIEGDLFIDCTGFRARLIEGALNTGYEEYGHFLPCDSAVAIQTASSGDPKVYTQSIAHESGWQWRIPLQHRVGNGLVYCSRYITDQDAESLLLSNLESEAITEPRMFKYKTGRRRKSWNKNCIALGLASGFLEPLESTSIHLATSSILRLLRMFPADGISQSGIDEFNVQTKAEMEGIRDFIILHYHVTQREDSAFWRYCKQMEIPQSLSDRLGLFHDTGSVMIKDSELFQIDSWTQVMFGQRFTPMSYHPIVDSMNSDELNNFLKAIRKTVDSNIDKLVRHQECISKYCKSDLM